MLTFQVFSEIKESLNQVKSCNLAWKADFQALWKKSWTFS